MRAHSGRLYRSTHLLLELAQQHVTLLLVALERDVLVKVRVLQHVDGYALGRGRG